MRTRRRPPRRRVGSDRWLLSYADFITLLLATFIVLYAISSSDMARLEEVMSGLNSAFSPNPRGIGVLSGDALPRGLASEAATRRGKAQAGAALELLLVRDRIQNTLDSQAEEADSKSRPEVRMRTSGRGLILSLASSDFFAAGGVEIHPEALATLDAIATALHTLSTPIRVEGHTDDRPIHSARFPSNWELSTARASAVVRQFISRHGFAPEQLIAAGYADTHPLVPNDSEANRALNRRIDLVVLNDAERAAEPEQGGDEAALRRVLQRLPPLD